MKHPEPYHSVIRSYEQQKELARLRSLTILYRSTGLILALIVLTLALGIGASVYSFGAQRLAAGCQSSPKIVLHPMALRGN